MDRPRTSMRSWAELHREIDAAAAATSSDIRERAVHIPGVRTTTACDRPPPYPLDEGAVDSATFTTEATEEGVAVSGNAFHDEQAWWDEQLHGNQNQQYTYQNQSTRSLFRPIVTPSAPQWEGQAQHQHYSNYGASASRKTEPGPGSRDPPRRPAHRRRKQLIIAQSPNAIGTPSLTTAPARAGHNQNQPASDSSTQRGRVCGKNVDDAIIEEELVTTQPQRFRRFVRPPRPPRGERKAELGWCSCTAAHQRPHETAELPRVCPFLIQLTSTFF